MNEPIILYSDSSIETKCLVSTNFSVSSLNLNYEWSYSISGNSFKKLCPSVNPTIFSIAPYFFNVSQTYIILLNVSIQDLGVYATNSISINVRSGKIISVIQGPSNRNVRVGDKLLIDASNSYDENISNKKGKFAGLVFKWSCIQTYPKFISDCSSIIANRSTSDSNLFVAYFSSEAVIQIELTVLDTPQMRSVATSVSVNVISKTSPLVINLVSKTNSYYINSNSQLQLIGSINTPLGLSGNVTWSIGADSSFNLENSALSPTKAYFKKVTYAFDPIITMTVGANTLPTGSTLTFILTGSVRYRGSLVSSSAYFTVTVNAPPRSGVFTVKPYYGTELTQPFNFFAQNWFGDNLPLTYQYLYLSAANNSITILSRSEKTHGSSILPAGSSVDDYVVTCYLVVYDFLDSSSKSDSFVQVTKTKAMNETEVSDYVDAKLQAGLTMKFDRNALYQFREDVSE